MSTIDGVTGNGGYKLGVNALITKTKSRYNDNQRRIERERENDCRELLVSF